MTNTSSLVRTNLNAAIDEVQSMKFTIYTKEDGDKRIEAAKLIKDANYVGTFWENGEWRGVLSLDKVMTEAIEKLEKDAEADFEIDWSTLMFVHQLMKSPKGYGVEVHVVLLHGSSMTSRNRN